MNKTSLTTILHSMVIPIFMTIALNGYSKSDPVIAYMVYLQECGEFFDGVATVGGSCDPYIFINRKGEKVGDAPGMMIHSDSKCRIFTNGNIYILTDKNNKRILKGEKEIKYISDGIYYISGGSFKGGDLIDHKGKVIKKYDKEPVFYSYKGSPEVIVLYDTEVKENGKKVEGSLQDVFSNGEYLFTGEYVSIDNLSPICPFIFYTTYDSESKRYSQKNAYIKATKECIKLSKSHISYIPGTNFFVNHDLIMDYMTNTPEDFVFINRRGQTIPFDSIATNSVGNKIIYDKDANGYRIIDTQGKILSKELIQSVDPYFWQSGILAAKVNDKWGYFNRFGGTYLTFEYDYAGPRIGDVCAVIKDSKPQILYFYDKDTFKSISIPNIKEESSWLHSYYVDIIDGYKTLFWERDDYQYGFYNLDKNKGIGDLGEIPQFEDGMACTFYKNSQDQLVGCLLSLDGEIKARSKGTSYFKYVGENLYSIDDFDNESNSYITYIYSKNGDLVYDSKSSGVMLEGKFHNGVVPIFVQGGVKKATKIEGYFLSYDHGYMYNTFSNTLEDILMNYGNMGQDDLVSEFNNRIKERIELLDYYQILGNKELERGNYNKAITYFNKALELHSIHNQSQFGKGIAYMSLGEFKYALQSLQYIDGISGADYAKALCYYNLGSYNKANTYISRVEPSDPIYKQSLELKQLITKALETERIEKSERRWNNAIAILGAISSGLQLFSQTMNAIQSPQQSYTPAPSYNYNSGNTSTRKTCSSCHGTGFNSAKERAAFYSYSEETYSNSPCEVCGDRDSHYHKPCPVCMGKGYTNY